MFPCVACSRHVRSGAASCPFCGTTLRDALAPTHAIAGVVLGLAMMGCGDRGRCENGATTADSSATTMQDANCGENSTYDTEAGNGADYGGSEAFDDPDTEDPTADPTLDDDTTTEGSTTDLGSTSTTGSSSTDTESTGTDTTGADGSTDTSGSSGSSDGGGGATKGPDEGP